jgi:hypothetical protein
LCFGGGIRAQRTGRNGTVGIITGAPKESFRPTFDIPVATHVTIKLFDVLGREVQTLLNENVEAGYRQVPLDASSLWSGIYFYRMQAGGFVSTRKAVVLT